MNDWDGGMCVCVCVTSGSLDNSVSPTGMHISLVTACKLTPTKAELSSALVGVSLSAVFKIHLVYMEPITFQNTGYRPLTFRY